MQSKNLQCRLQQTWIQEHPSQAGRPVQTLALATFPWSRSFANVTDGGAVVAEGRIYRHGCEVQLFSVR